MSGYRNMIMEKFKNAAGIDDDLQDVRLFFDIRNFGADHDLSRHVHITSLALAAK